LESDKLINILNYIKRTIFFFQIHI